MHLKFFDQTSETGKIRIPLITKFTSNKKIVPFRHLKCKTPECIYDIDELVKKYSSNFSSKFSKFACFYCNTQIDL